MLRSWRIIATLVFASVPLNAQNRGRLDSPAHPPAAVSNAVAREPLFKTPALVAAPPCVPTPISPSEAHAAAPAERVDAAVAAEFRGEVGLAPEIRRPPARAAEPSEHRDDDRNFFGGRYFDGSDGVVVHDTDGLSGEALLIRVSRIAGQGQKRRTSLNRFFSTLENHERRGVRGVTDAYSGIFVPGTSDSGDSYSVMNGDARDGSSGIQTMNVEHVYPKSLFGKGADSLPMRWDLHNLMAVLRNLNGIRDNHPYGAVNGRPFYRNAAGAKGSDRLFEPPDFTKGRVARAMLYIYVRYKDKPFIREKAAIAFWESQVVTLLNWNRRFPPTAEERARNDRAETLQGNRNPFADDHRLADRIGLRVLSPSRRASAESARRKAGRR